MRFAVDTRRNLIVAAIFAVTVGIGFAGTAWLNARDIPNPLQACIRKCADLHRDGKLVYDGPDTPKNKDAYRVCECS
jgi:hypothetical protein